MNNSGKGEFYFGISDKKIHICYFESDKSEFKNSVNFEIPDSISSDLNFKIIFKLLKENIKKLEKKLGIFLNSGNISIQSSSYQSILISVKNIYDKKKLNTEDIGNLIQTGYHHFNINNKNLSIIHIIINKYIIDDKVYKLFPNNIFFKKIVLEIEFICLDQNLINKVKNLFKECNINLNKIVAFDYCQKFFKKDQDTTMCMSARSILKGANVSEVLIKENSNKNPALFDKIFNFFD